MNASTVMERANGPVTVLITRRVRPGHELQFERVMQRMVAAAQAFPLVLLLSPLMAPVFVPIHPVLSVMVVTAGVVVLMSWAVMPLLTRLFAPWLYPQLGTSDGASNLSQS